MDRLPSSHRLVIAQGKEGSKTGEIRATCTCGAYFDAPFRNEAFDALVVHQKQMGTRRQGL